LLRSSAAMFQAVCPSKPLDKNRSSLRFNCTSLPKHHNFSKISFLRSSAAMFQAVCPSKPLENNRSSLRFTCTSPPQHHNFSKISLLPSSAAMFQVVCPTKPLYNNRSSLRFIALLYTNTTISLKSLCCLPLLLCSRQFVQKNLCITTDHL